MLHCWHLHSFCKPLWLTSRSQKHPQRAFKGHASCLRYRGDGSRRAFFLQCLQQPQDDTYDGVPGLQLAHCRRAVVLSMIGILQLSGPVHALAETSQGGEVGAEAPASTLPAEERSVPRGVRPGRPVLAQPVETSQTSSKASIQDSNLSPDAAGKPIDSRAVPDPILKPPAEKLVPKEANGAKLPKSVSSEDNEKEAKRLLDEEEERRKQRRRKKGRIRELEEIRAELAEKELVLLSKEQELLERDQTVNVLREELELEKKLRTLLTKEKEKAEEQSALALGLCTGGSIF